MGHQEDDFSSVELRVIAARIDKIAGALQESQRSIEHPDTTSATSRDQAGRLARLIYNKRRKRSRWFAEVDFGEPAWDILLDLYASEAEGKTVNVSSACIAAAVPPTTALRWLTSLEAEGWVQRTPNPDDRRTSTLRLTKKASEAMTGYLLHHGSLV
jgi:DNA-binding MarR family transcriptional regulator